MNQNCLPELDPTAREWRWQSIMAGAGGGHAPLQAHWAARSREQPAHHMQSADLKQKEKHEHQEKQSTQMLVGRYTSWDLS